MKELDELKMRHILLVCVILSGLLGCLDVSKDETMLNAKKLCDADWDECKFVGSSQMGNNMYFRFSGYHGGVYYKNIEYACTRNFWKNWDCE